MTTKHTNKCKFIHLIKTHCVHYVQNFFLDFIQCSFSEGKGRFGKTVKTDSGEFKALSLSKDLESLSSGGYTISFNIPQIFIEYLL